MKLLVSINVPAGVVPQPAGGVAPSATVIVAVASFVPVPPALFAVTVTAYVPAVGRLLAGMVQVEPVQLPTVEPSSFHTYELGVLVQLADSCGEEFPVVTEGDDGLIVLQDDKAS